jgi:hypothetical protein
MPRGPLARLPFRGPLVARSPLPLLLPFRATRGPQAPAAGRGGEQVAAEGYSGRAQVEGGAASQGKAPAIDWSTCFFAVKIFISPSTLPSVL